jgi:hypothetical protein
VPPGGTLEEKESVRWLENLPSSTELVGQAQRCVDERDRESDIFDLFGAVLHADFSANLNSCIAIRSMLAVGGKGYVQAGAGIVADSVPELEHQKTINKASAVIRAIERAREM